MSMRDSGKPSEAQIARLKREITTLTRERDYARYYARILAHSYTHDSRPPQAVVDAALAYPVVS